jgi:acetyl esterase/lipase
MDRSRAALSFVAAVVLALGCGRKEPENGAQPKPRTSPPELQSGEMKAAPQKEIHPKDPMAAADGDMRLVLRQLDTLGAKHFQGKTVEQVRALPTVADAIAAIQKAEGRVVAPIEMAKIEDRKIPSPANGTIDVRIYTPKNDTKRPAPVVVYYHGGGFVLGSLDGYDASARAIAKHAEAIVVSADYRHAPENKFPAAHDDAYAAYDWVLKNAGSFGGDRKRVAVAGEGAGGNLAASVSLTARDKRERMPLHQLLVHPITETDMNTESYIEWQNAKPLDRGNMVWLFDKYLRGPADAKDPRVNLMAADVRGMPSTTIVLAEIDPLRSDGELFAEKLKAAGVRVEKKVFTGVTHEFFGMGAVVADARDAQEWAGDRLEDALER